MSTPRQLQVQRVLELLDGHFGPVLGQYTWIENLGGPVDLAKDHVYPILVGAPPPVSARKVRDIGGIMEVGNDLSNRRMRVGGDRWSFDADDYTFVACTATTSGVVLAGGAGGPLDAEDDYLLAYIPFPGVHHSHGGDFTVTWHEDGILSYEIGDE